MTIINQIISFKLSGISYSGTSTQLNSTAGVTPGTCIASKALIVDSFRNITNINALTVTTLNATTINGTLASGPQTGITSLGTLANMSISNNMNIVGHDGGTRGLVLGSTLVTSSGLQLNYNNVTTIGVAEASKALILNSSGSISGINSLSSTSLNTTNLTINGTLLTVSGTQLNYNNVTTPGMAQNSRSLVLDSNGSISGIISLSTFGLTATNITGTLTSGPQNNITSVGTLTGLTMSGAISGVTNITMSGNLTTTGNITANNLSGTITTSAQPNITSLGNISNLTVTGQITVDTISATNISVGGTNITSALTNLGSISGITNGTALAGKALILDASRNIININSLTSTTLVATNITGSLSTASQPNITSLGTLTNLAIGGSITSVTNIAMTGSLSGANSISSTSLNGRIDTSSQPNITSLGTLTNLLVNGNIGMGMASNSLPPAQLIINSSNGSCLRLSFNEPTGNAVNFTDFTLNSSGALTVNSSNNLINLRSNIVIGKSDSENVLYFNGVTGDAANSTVISERIYNTNGEFSELLLFKGNDLSGSFGPDRIRLRAGEIRFQFINSGEDYSTLADSNTALIMGSDGRIGINSNVNPTQQLTINNSAGTCVRLVNSNNTNTAVNINIPSAGTINFKTSSSTSLLSTTLQIGDSVDTTNNSLLIGTSSTTLPTGGLIRLVTAASGGNYIQSGVGNVSGSASDLIIGDMSQTITASARKIIFKADGKVGFGTSAPTRALEINDALGNCLRLTHNDNDGSATTYCDQTIGTSGLVTFDAVGTSPSFSFTKAVSITGNLTVNGNITPTSIVGVNILSGSQNGITLVGTLTGLTVSGSTILNNTVNMTNVTDATTNTNGGCLTISGGTAIAKKLFVGGATSLNGALGVTGATTLSSTLGVTGPTTLSSTLSVNGVTTLSNTLSVNGTVTAIGLLTASGGINSNGTITSSGNISTTGSGTITSAGLLTALNGLNITGTLNLSAVSPTTGIQCILSAGGFGGIRYSQSGGSAIAQTYAGTNDAGIGTSSGHPFGLITNGSYKMYISSDGNIGIGTLSPLHPLHIATTSSNTVTGTYAYIIPNSQLTTITATASGISLFTSGRIYCGNELNVASDRRVKENIQLIEDDFCEKFIKLSKPVKYNYINQDDLQYGYIAQDLLGLHLGDGIVSIIENPDLLDTIDEASGIKNPKGIQFTIAYDKIVPILGNGLKIAYNKIDTLYNQIKEINEQKNKEINDLKQQMVEMQKTLELLLQKN